MKIFYARCIFILFACLSAVLTRADGYLFGGTELESIVALAMENNPEIRAAGSIYNKFAADHDFELGFFDPDFSFSAGAARWSRPVPWSSLGAFAEDNAYSGKAGLEFPLLPGAYFSVGVAERYLLEPGADFDSLYQTSAGGGLWVPLARDRGLAQWKAREQAARYRKESARYALLQTVQRVRLSVETAYIDLLRAAAAVEEAEMSAARVASLLSEAKELVALKVVPSYQLHPAKMEVATQKDELVAARHVLEAGILKMSALVGVDVSDRIALEPDTVLKWASECGNPPVASIEDVLNERGSYLTIESTAKAVESDIRSAAEKMKSDFGLSMRAVWQGENEDNLLGSDLLLSERHLGAEAVVVWRRPLGFKPERAELAANKALLRAVSEEMRGVRLNIELELASARSALKAATERLDAAYAAVSEAEKALMAEDERFKMGEGRSRNVLDAQKDLTTVVRRRNNAAAELLKAFANIRHASGYLR